MISFMLTRIYASKTKENKKDTGADRFQQQCFESLKKYVKEKIILEGRFLLFLIITESYRWKETPLKILKVEIIIF